MTEKERLNLSNYKEFFCSFRRVATAIWLLVCLWSVANIVGTNAQFANEVSAIGSTFAAADDFSATGNVVINELMWMGSFGDENDEWIELRNLTDEEIDLSGWRILGGGKGNKNKHGQGDGAHLQIPAGYSIKANGYFLMTKKKWNETKINLTEDLAKDEGLTHLSALDLKNGSEKLTLEDPAKNVIDRAWKDGMGHWPAGWHGFILQMSMERDDAPGDGTSTSRWHTCTDGKCNDKTYWKREGVNFGTPGQKNLGEDYDVRDACDKSEKDAFKKTTKDANVLHEFFGADPTEENLENILMEIKNPFEELFPLPEAVEENFEVPGMPEVPEIPEMPEVPATSTEPEAPVAPDAPSLPGGE